jgi:hypothetical protein
MQKLKLDEGVPVVPGRRSRAMDDPRAAQLLAMDIDTGKNSFYLEGKTKKDVRSLVALGRRIGVYLIVREFAAGTDAINDEAGVRVWRVREEKAVRKPKVTDDL